jgi:hypothetical protein
MAPWTLPTPTVCTNIGSASTKNPDNPIHINSIALQPTENTTKGSNESTQTSVKNQPQAKQVLLSMAPVVSLRRGIDAQTISQST